MRRTSALAGLLELGRADSAVATLAENHRADFARHLNPFEEYSAAIAVIVEHWPALQPLMERAGLDAEFPVENLLNAGYGSLVAQSRSGQLALDLYLQGPHEGPSSRQKLQELARGFPRSDLLRDKLLAALG